MVSTPSIDVRQGKQTLVRGAELVRFGKGPEATVKLTDPLLKDLHFEVRVGDGFQIADLGSSTGTYVDGVPAHRVPNLADGARIVAGTTVLLAALEQRDGASVLVLSVDKSPFHLNRPGRTDSDADRWVVDELAMSRFPKLTVSNRVAAVVALVLTVAGIIGATLLEPLVDAGPLVCSHAVLFRPDHDDPELRAARAAIDDFERFASIATAAGCAACHEGGELPERNCAHCHDADFRVEERGVFRHPYVSADRQLGDLADLGLGSDFCVDCHTDHQRPDFLKPSSHRLVGDCAACHGDEPPSWQPPVIEERPRPFSSVDFSHASHLAAGREIDCSVCHRADEAARFDAKHGGSRAAPYDFAPVPFEVCAQCHVESGAARPTADPRIAAAGEAWRPTAPWRWSMDWHGSTDDDSQCARCHTPSAIGDGFGPDLVSVARFDFDARTAAETKARYTVERRSHAEQFRDHAGDRACSDCHRRNDALVDADRREATFWHGLHVPAASLGAADQESQETVSETVCRDCHADRDRAVGLVADGWWRWDPAGRDTTAADCGRCHREASDAPLRIAPADPGAATQDRLGATRSQPDFPHADHTTVEGGCFACHSFRPAADPGFEFERIVHTPERVKDCTACHERHQEIQAGSCFGCHSSERQDDALAWNVYLASAGVSPGTTLTPGTAGRPLQIGPLPVREAANDRDFSHFSSGHVDVTDCTDCHTLDALRTATTLGEVPIPHENADISRDLCWTCHREQQFHWRAR